MQNRDAVELSACCDAFLWCSGVFFFRFLLQRIKCRFRRSNFTFGMGREKDIKTLKSWAAK
jgi:hypothetical protein